MTVLPSRFRTVKVVLLVVLTAILATVAILLLRTNDRVDELAEAACHYMTTGATWEGVQAVIIDGKADVGSVQLAMIEKCPDVALGQ